MSRKAKPWRVPISPGRWEALEYVPSMGRRAFRLTLCLGWPFVLVQQQLRCRGTGDEWQDNNACAGVWLRWAWRWGVAHDYYDGPHCTLNLGPLVFLYAFGWCEKAMPSSP